MSKQLDALAARLCSFEEHDDQREMTAVLALAKQVMRQVQHASIAQKHPIALLSVCLHVASKRYLLFTFHNTK